MPTPFYHLSIANQLVHHPDLPASLRAYLTEQHCAFFFGKTVPDVQTLSGQPRPDTHFYRVPLKDTTAPWEHMFKHYPDLAHAEQLSPEKAAFIAGYICHLQADVIWIMDLFVPYFLPRLAKGGRRQMGYLHNVLRAYLDEQIYLELQNEVGFCLSGVHPDGWLPFVEKQYLYDWRDFIAQQLMPGAAPQTVEVFAARSQMTPDEFLLLLRSEERMEQELFSFVPRHVLVEYRDKLVAENIKLLSSYLAGIAG